MRPLALSALLVVAAVAGVVAPVDASDGPCLDDCRPAWTDGSSAFESTDGAVSNLAFYTDYDDDPRPIRVGFTAEANTTVAFALHTDGDIVGHTDYRQYDQRVHADGLHVPLDENLTGDVELTVVALADSNGNGVVDSDDEPYRVDGEPVAATMTFDFGTDGEMSTTDGGTSTSTGESGGAVPGFGPVVVAGALAAAWFVALRGR